ncbi:hypothetical protein ACFVTC_33675 [Streptomyces sp. NPDC057950]|uniref:hypothetical protein n=1 Tax=Streptomyces sp. NPDC057950 TaxID=3346288 RepID=UPI0036E2DEA5
MNEACVGVGGFPEEALVVGPSRRCRAASLAERINVKPSIAAGGGFDFVPVPTCFYPTSGSSYCNAYRDITVGTWSLAATDVKDGTRFIVQFQFSTKGSIAY